MREDLGLRTKEAVLEALKGQEIHPEAVATLLREVERRPLAGTVTLHLPFDEITAWWAGGNAVIAQTKPLRPLSRGSLPARHSPAQDDATPPLAEVEVPPAPRLAGWLEIALRCEERYRERALALAQRLLLDLPPPKPHPGWRGEREIVLGGLAPAWRSRTHHRPLILWRPGLRFWGPGRPSELLKTPFPFFAVSPGRELRHHPLAPGAMGRLVYASPFPTWKEDTSRVRSPKELFAPYLGEEVAEGVGRGDPEALEEAARKAALYRMGG